MNDYFIYIFDFLHQKEEHLIEQESISTSGSSFTASSTSSRSASIAAAALAKTQTRHSTESEGSSTATTKTSNSTMPPITDIKQQVQKIIDGHAIVVFSKTTCPFCEKVSVMFE